MNKNREPEILKNNTEIIASGIAVIAMLFIVIGFEFSALKELGGLNKHAADNLMYEQKKAYYKNLN